MLEGKLFIFEGQLLIGSLMISASVVFHVTVLVYLSHLLKRSASRMTHLPGLTRAVAMMAFSVFIIIGVHTGEAWAWAGLYLYLQEFSSLDQALYFSVVTSTTLGYGDLTLSPKSQLLGTFEAMGGLILFGVSTAFLMEIMRRLFNDTTK
jgi:hypothetical protein